MKLYLFRTTIYSAVPKLTVEEFDVEEKPKTYVCRGRRFNKTDVGHVSGYGNNECILLENNPSKACSILLLQKENELRMTKEEVSRKESEINNLKRYIKSDIVTVEDNLKQLEKNYETEYAVEVYDKNGTFNRQLDVFSTFDEAKEFEDVCEEQLSEEEYIGILAIRYDKDGNENAVRRL